MVRPHRRSIYGFSVSGSTDRVFRDHRNSGLRLRTAAETLMSWVYILSSVLAAGILVYLVIALLFPEKF
jgi:K+-transporting ATPase KdpF subunit